MTDQAKKDFDKIVDDLSNTTTGLLPDIHAAIGSTSSTTQKAVYHDLITLYYGVQKLIEHLPSPPVNVDSLITTALSVTDFFERSSNLVHHLDNANETTWMAVVKRCNQTKREALAALDHAYNNLPASDELSFAKLQAAVDALETEAITKPKPSTFEDDVSKQLKIANKSLKALQEADFQPRQDQVRAYTREWFDVTKHLDAKSEKKGKHREHIASLIEIRDGLSAVTSRLGVLAEVSVGIDIPEF
jgi:hypothetical protein